MHNDSSNEVKRHENEEKGHRTRNIKFLLQHHYRFRLWIKFKYDPEYGPERMQGGMHFYGNEHKCSYGQCLNRKIPFIILDRLKGYQDLIKLVEKGDFRGKYLTAKIYGFDPETGGYDIQHRVYLKGKLQKAEVNDPVIDTSEQFLTLYYGVENGRVIINETDTGNE